MSLTFAHIVNPYAAPEGSDTHRIQGVTFRSLKDSADHAGRCPVQLHTVQFAEDREIIPPQFIPLPDLTRSVCDLHDFSVQRRYPLIADILQSAHGHTEAEFIIYTNMDIIVQPFFHEAVARMLDEGTDALIINRRRIADRGQTADDLPLILADVGRAHPGFDCFVMHRSLIPKFLLEGICVGVPFMEAALMYNMVAFAKRCRIITDAHLTTHLGLDVMPSRDPEYHGYNRVRFKAILPGLKPHLVGKQLPYTHLPLLQRTWKRVLNPAVFSGLHLELEGKGALRRLYAYWNELRFRMLER